MAEGKVPASKDKSARTWKYEELTEAADFIDRLPQKHGRAPEEPQKGAGVLFLYRSDPMWFPGFIAKFDQTFLLDNVQRSFGGGRFILKAKWGRRGLTTRVHRFYGDPIPSEIESTAQAAVRDYLFALEQSEHWRHHHWISSRVSYSPHWLRALLRRLNFDLRREKPRPDGRRYSFPLLDEDPDPTGGRGESHCLEPASGIKPPSQQGDGK